MMMLGVQSDVAWMASRSLARGTTASTSLALPLSADA
jgi:hypothetical protein